MVFSVNKVPLVKTGKRIFLWSAAVSSISGRISGSPPAKRIKLMPRSEASVKISDHLCAVRISASGDSAAAADSLHI